MFKYFLFCFSFLFLGLNIINANAADRLPSNYYPYNDKILDFYIGGNLATFADVSTNNQAGNPDWQALYNPVHLLGASGISANVGIRPLAVLPFFRNFRFEAEWQYRVSSYNILYDTKKASWILRSRLPDKGDLTIKNGLLFNLYYDFRWLNNIFYPYVGVGFGTSQLIIRNLDFEILPNGVGAEYRAQKIGVPISQLILGFQYDTKIIKTSFYVEYRYERTGTITAKPTYFGDENGTATPNPGVEKSSPKKIGFKSHTLVAGLKYYLY